MMNYMANFFLTQWLWSVTFGMYQLLIATVLFFLLLKLWDHLTLLRALAMSVGLSVGAFLILSAGVILIVIGAFDMKYVLPANPYEDQFTVFSSALSLAAIYIVLEFILVLIAKRWFRLQVYNVMVSAFVANILAALIVYKLVQKL